MKDISDIFCPLSLAKTLHDRSRFKNIFQSFGLFPLDGDCTYEMAMEAASSVFKGTGVYYSDDECVETWVLADPVIDRFCELCIRLEREKGLDEELNPYRRNAEKMIHEGFCLDGFCYDYDWRLAAEYQGNWCVLFYANDEFYGLGELPEAFMDIFEGFQELNRQLETELGLNKIIPIYPFMNQWKEAA